MLKMLQCLVILFQILQLESRKPTSQIPCNHDPTDELRKTKSINSKLLTTTSTQDKKTTLAATNTPLFDKSPGNSSQVYGKSSQFFAASDLMQATQEARVSAIRTACQKYFPEVSSCK